LVDMGGITVSESLADVETLNRLALDARYDLTKVSFHALAFLRDNYCLLRSGGAVGRGCGPLVLTRRPTDMSALSGKRIAIPGRFTTAYMLLMLYGDQSWDVVEMPFDRIMDAVQSGEVDAGLVIHESRFTYHAHGLHKSLDLGEWWESETGLPIPLGGILARRTLGVEVVRAVESGIRRSIEYARRHPEAAKPYIKEYAQEMDDAVIDSHIGLYVNEFSLDLGEEGMSAVEELFARAEYRRIIPTDDNPLFL
ncbi:MAG: 1,4-dihydroxy-6-naphthoate synthase, partial [Nitrospirae bacterium]|nr:1,4-dihydroxy-6-naphthoate synthase [Nitrospirota bacterium]